MGEDVLVGMCISVLSLAKTLVVKTISPTFIDSVGMSYACD